MRALYSRFLACTHTGGAYTQGAFASLTLPNAFFLTKLPFQRNCFLFYLYWRNFLTTNTPLISKSYLFFHDQSHHFLTGITKNLIPQGIGHITLHSWRHVLNLSRSRQLGLHGQNSRIQGKPTSTVSPVLCSLTSCQLCCLNSLNGQPNNMVCNSWGCACVLGAQHSIFPG